MVEAFLADVSLISLRVLMQVLDQVEQGLIAQRRQRELQLEQARYESRLAQRQYDAVDPSHRLVAAELERRWNEQRERVAQLEQTYAQADSNHAVVPRPAGNLERGDDDQSGKKPVIAHGD